MTQDVEYLDVLAFHEKFGQLISYTPTHLTQRKATERIKFMQEELDEFVEAVAHQDMGKMFDALLDLVYVAKGTAVMMGLPWQAGWDDVQAANMRKVPGVTHRGNKVDVIKPPGWVGPDNDGVLERAGYDKTAFKLAYWDGGEAICLDDPVHREPQP